MPDTLIDTNILVYFADNTDKKKHLKAKKILNNISKHPEEYAICLQSLREFASVMLKKKNMGRKKIIEYLEAYLDVFEDTYPDTPEDTIKALEKESMHFWDSLLAETAKRNEIMEILTENTSDFQNITGIRTTNPFK